MNSSATSLRDRLAQPKILLAPGVYDALSALLAQQAGFEAVYLSGASIAYTQFGAPDIGLVDRGEVATVLANICQRIDRPVIVDGDTGFGNALNVQRTVRSFEIAGAAAIQIEDQTLPKRCGHLKGKTLVRALALAGQSYFASLAEHGDTRPYRDRMLDLDGLNELIATPEVLARGARYDPSRFEDSHDD